VKLVISKDFNDILKEYFESRIVSEHNQKIWLNYFDDMQVLEEVSQATVKNNMDFALFFRKHVNIDLDKLTEYDLKRFYTALENHQTARGKTFSEVTKKQYKVALKRF
jgi:hypothetical protein